ncbi:hypothetical protein KSP39_PZI021514 [Platanthera zijinensis]|uniref:Expansin-like EG45 domain-containing protein n=1 Tax=Platanthera zijinensis TaxID=2320716 RepID=A0AAP0FWD3_9ASPA
MRKANLVLGLIAMIIAMINCLHEEFSLVSYYNAHNPGSNDCGGELETFSATAGIKVQDSGNPCGKRYLVKCVEGGPMQVPCRFGGEISVIIQRLCNNLCDDEYDMYLSEEAFAKIADIDRTHVIKIAYRPEI